MAYHRAVSSHPVAGLVAAGPEKHQHSNDNAKGVPQFGGTPYLYHKVKTFNHHKMGVTPRHSNTEALEGEPICSSFGGSKNINSPVKSVDGNGPGWEPLISLIQETGMSQSNLKPEIPHRCLRCTRSEQVRFAPALPRKS